jgi:hypothetical protein
MFLLLGALVVLVLVAVALMLPHALTACLCPAAPVFRTLGSMSSVVVAPQMTMVAL